MLEICREHDVLVLEDNPYGLLGFDSEPMRALRADEPDGVIYLGSFSKTFSPGMRVGWALAPHAVREKLVLAQESATLCPPAFTQMAVSAYLTTHDWQGQIKQMREMYRERRDAMIAALHDFMPAACTWNVPDGGFFVWVDACRRGSTPRRCCPARSPPGWPTCPARPSSPTASARPSMRLSYCYPTPERIREGVRRLAGVLEEEMELRATFGASGPSHELPSQRLRRPEQRPELEGDPMSSTETPAREGRVVVLAGGLSHERDVSLRSGRRVAEALRGTGVEVEERDVDAALLPALTADPPACVVPMLHGETGEDGAIREVLELLGVPYVGATPAACRIAFDKPVAKTVVARGRRAHARVVLPAARDVPRARARPR